jgi:hypothetical protein
MEGLREYATDPELPDIEILDQFVCYDQAKAENRDGVCICKKTELVKLFFMFNRKKKDFIDRITSTLTVGKSKIH